MRTRAEDGGAEVCGLSKSTIAAGSLWVLRAGPADTRVGAAWRILEAMPEANVKLFAMARRGLVDLVVGTVEHHGRNYLVRKPR